MLKEYKLIIRAIGSNAEEATENAVNRLNEGANFDEVVYLNEWFEPMRQDRLRSMGPVNRLVRFIYSPSATHRN
jgi:hypothetical protein